MWVCSGCGEYLDDVDVFRDEDGAWHEVLGSDENPEMCGPVQEVA